MRLIMCRPRLGGKSLNGHPLRLSAGTCDGVLMSSDDWVRWNAGNSAAIRFTTDGQEYVWLIWNGSNL